MRKRLVGSFVAVAWLSVAWAWAAEPVSNDQATVDAEVPAEWRGRALLTKPPDIVLRKLPDAQAPVAAVLPAGIWLYVQRVEGDWFSVRYGWLRAADVVRDDEAIDYFKRQLATAETAFAHLCRSRAWLLKQVLDKAQADIGEAARLDPQNARIFLARARIAHAEQRYDDELAAYDRRLAHSSVPTSDHGLSPARLSIVARTCAPR
ncbi:MAG TPA: hypothetical protein VNH11_01455 [Pirellulales bacterium]|nr:hypothetical protein [Pirellulales bacterium]